MEIGSLSAIGAEYFPEREIITVQKIRHGLINNSYKIQLDNGSSYFLQKVNPKVFLNPPLLDKNLSQFFAFMKSRWGKINLHPLELIQNIKGATLTKIEGDFWRIMNFISSANTIHIPKDKEQLQNSGKAYAQLLSTMSEASLSNYNETIPDFFDSRSRLKQLTKAVKEDKANRRSRCAKEIDKCFEFFPALEFESLKPSFKHLCINDCKISNVLFDSETKNVKAIVDFDTIMRGSYYMDFADMVRAGCCSVSESNQKKTHVLFDQSMFSALVEGFWFNLKVENFKIEKELIWLGLINVIWQQFSRFLTDHLNGDEYFHVDQQYQNLNRAKNQSSLLFETSKLKSRLLLSLQTLFTKE